MSKYNFEKEFSSIEKRFTDVLDEKEVTKKNLLSKIEKAEGELKALDGVEFLQLANGSEEELDEVLLKREVIKKRIEAYKAEINKTSVQDIENIFRGIARDTLKLDAASEQAAADEIKDLLGKVADILKKREEERNKIDYLQQRCVASSFVDYDKMVEMGMVYTLISFHSNTLGLLKILVNSPDFITLSGGALKNPYLNNLT